MSSLDFNNNFLNQIVFHAIQNDEFLSRIRGNVNADMMKSRERIHILSFIYDYYDEFKCAPKDNFFDIFSEAEKTMPDSLYDRCIRLIGVLKDITGSNSEYILKRVSEAIMHFRLENASIDFASMIKQGKYDDAKALILSAMREPEGIEKPYFDYFEDKSYIYERLKENRYKMTTMIAELDALIGGFNPTWLVTILGATKGGKSWWLTELAIAGVLQGLNVTIVSLEMDKTVLKERLDQSIGFMTSKQSGHGIDMMVERNGEWEKGEGNADSIYDIDKVEKNSARLKKISGGGLKVIAFNQGRLNYMDIDRFLEDLEQREGFITELLIVDYLGIMKETTMGQSKKDRITENCLGLKEICGRRHLIGATAMQGNRTAMQAKVFHSHMVADDIDTIFNSDLVMAICQTKREEEQGRYRLYVSEYRHGPKGTSVGLIRDLAIGQIARGTFEIEEETYIPDGAADAANDVAGTQY